MIYIDPPYNTGNDFVYPDNYADPLQPYLQLTGQMDAEGNLLRVLPETEASVWLVFGLSVLFAFALMIGFFPPNPSANTSQGPEGFPSLKGTNAIKYPACG